MRVTLRAVGADNFVVVAGVGRQGGRCWEARNFSVRAYLRTHARHALEEALTFVVVVGVGGEELLGVVVRVNVYHSERVMQRRVLVAAPSSASVFVLLY